MKFVKDFVIPVVVLTVICAVSYTHLFCKIPCKGLEYNIEL